MNRVQLLGSVVVQADAVVGDLVDEKCSGCWARFDAALKLSFNGNAWGAGTCRGWQAKARRNQSAWLQLARDRGHEPERPT